MKLALVETYHPKARCRWCAGRFVLVYGGEWMCETPACADRQIAHAMRRDGGGPGDPLGQSHASPFIWLPTPVQVELIESRVRNLLWGGAAAGSKSHGLRWNGYRSCRDIAGYECLILRRTFVELESTHLSRMERVDQQLLGAKYVGGTDRAMRFPNGSFMRAGHCDSKGDVTKHLSTEWDEIIFDEGATFEGNMLQEISVRARTATSKRAVNARGGAFVRIGSNPGGVGALYLKDFYIDRTPDPIEYPDYQRDRYAFIQAKLVDNPYADEDYEATLMELSAMRRRQLLDGDWSVFGSQFFATWNPEIHVRPYEAA